MVTPIDQRPRSGPYSGLNARSAKRFLAQQFREAGLPFAEDDALDLVLAATGYSAADLIARGTEFLTPEVFETISTYAERRLSGEPVDHILGWRAFYGRRFAVNRHVLSPRGDTETLIQKALDVMEETGRLLDLGTGSGALAVTLLAERPGWRGLATDMSAEALRLALDNADQYLAPDQLDFIDSDWWADIPSQQFDLIVSNPPYIDDTAMDGLETEVKTYDPDLALRGGADGLNAYRKILDQSVQYLAPSAWLIVEIGFDQGTRVPDLFRAAGLANVALYHDPGGNPRIVVGQAPSAPPPTKRV